MVISGIFKELFSIYKVYIEKMPRFVKGSQEAKDYMASIRAKKGQPKDANAPAKKVSKKAKKADKGPSVKIGFVGEDTLVLPEFYATEGKAGKLKLVNPITQERHLAKRKKQLVLKIARKPVDGPVLIDAEDKQVPVKRFGKKDRAKLEGAIEKVKSNAGKSVEERPDIPFEKPKTRGRPETLPRNIKMNRLKKILTKATTRQTKQAFDKLKDEEQMPLPEEEEEEEKPKKKKVVKNISIDIGKKDEPPPPPPPAPTVEAPKRGRKAKYTSEEERKAAIKKQKADSAKKIYQAKKAAQGKGIMKTFKKGSQEAKDFMAKLRSMKGKCGSGVYPNPLHPATTSIEKHPHIHKEQVCETKTITTKGMGIMKSFKKGSQEAKDFMAKLRSMRKK